MNKSNKYSPEVKVCPVNDGFDVMCDGVDDS